jgi:methyl-accepting chemotaxis protein
LLENFDKDGDWHYVKEERKATYTNLDPGKYIFHVKGANNAGLWNEKAASLEIIITPPLWGTWWFRIGMIGLAGFLTIFLYKLRTRSIKERNLHLENEVKSRTEEVLKHKDQVEKAYSRMNQAVQKITMSMEKMTNLADIVSETSSEFKSTSQRLATGANEHASSISEISSSLRELFTSASTNAGNAQDANEISSQTQTLMTNSIEDMKNLSGVMKRIHHSTNETESVIRTMEEIATMIQMLSVNAAIEAMRAGEMGKGFQAVAKEVQKLAEQSETAVQSTKNLIHNAIEQVEKGTQINQEVVKRFKDFSRLIERITVLIGEISSASVQQKLGIDQINTGVEQLNKVMQMSTDAAHDSVNRSENLFVHVEELRTLVNILNEAVQHLVGEQS